MPDEERKAATPVEAISNMIKSKTVLGSMSPAGNTPKFSGSSLKTESTNARKIS